MPTCSYKLPADLADDIAGFEGDMKRFLSGELASSLFKAKRVPRGIYEQRRDGTYMIRVRLPGGVLSVAQARALAELGRQYGNGTLHVTTRQDIQLHDVSITAAPTIMRGLLAAGLTCKGGGGNTVRNVVACPYAGICPCERFDVTPYALAVTEYLITLTGSYNLPRKYKIAFSGCTADCALAEVNDLGFIAHWNEGRPGFAVYAGGGMGSDPRIGDQMLAWLPAGECTRAAEAVRRLFDRLGDRRNRRRARLRFAVAKVGAAAFAEMFHRELAVVTAEGVPECKTALPPSEAGNSTGNIAEAFVWRNGLRVLPQCQKGLVAVPVPLPLGQITWSDLKTLADIAERFSGEKGLRAMASQKLLLRAVRESDFTALRGALQGLKGNVASIRPLDAFVACTGAATCRLGLCLSQHAARACAEALERAGLSGETLQGLDIRMNGCSNSCGQHPIGTVGLFGVALRVADRLVPAYRVLLGARRGEGLTRFGEPVGTVSARALPAFMLELVQDFQANRHTGEALSDYYDRRGRDHFKAIGGRHARIPAYSEDPAWYRDWGRAEDFSLAGRGPGECGAGVFEVIGEDIAAARKALADAAQAPDKPEALFGAMLAASRALLVTRGIEVQKPDDVFRAFETHFVDTALVPAESRGLLACARGYVAGWREAFLGKQKELRQLVDRVDFLFSVLDADLKFQTSGTPATAATTAADKAQPGTAHLDLRGVACPMNFVKAKLKLETMAVGEVLRVALDDGEPIQNVPASFKNEGQEVLETVRRDDGHWQVDIRKKQ